MLSARCIVSLAFLYSVACRSNAQELPHTYHSNLETITRTTLRQYQTDTATILNTIRIAHAVREQWPDSALTLYNAALRKAGEILFSDGCYFALTGIARCYAHMGHYQTAVPFLKKAFPYAAYSSDKSLLAKLYSEIATLYFYMGEYGKAIFYDYQVLLESIHNPAVPGTLIITTYSNIGSIWGRVGQIEASIDFLKRAERIARANRDSVRLARIYITMGTTYFTTDMEKTLYYSMLALQLRGNSSEYQPEDILAMINIGRYYIKKQQFAKAIVYCNQAKKTAEELKGSTYAAQAYSALGDAYYAGRDYKKAEQTLLAALNIFPADNKDAMVNIHKTLAAIYAATGDYRQAYKHQDSYTELYKELLNREAVQLLEQEKVKYKTAEKDREIAQQQNILREKNIWIGSISAGALLLTGLLASLYRANRHRQQVQQKHIHILQQEQKIAQLKAIMEGEEQERSRIARELHDGIGSRLATVKMNFSILQYYYEPLLPPTNDFREILNLLTETCNEVRETAHNLMPAILIHHGLNEALKLYCDTVNNTNKLFIDLRVHCDLSHLDHSFSLSVYRIIQELLQNILKHSQATHALIQINERDNMLNLLVEDNGKGFDHTENRSGGMGLQNIRLRVKILHGEFIIQSGKKMGTLVYIKFDLKQLKTQD